MYQKIITLAILAICSYTDIRYRKVYGWSLVLYGILAAGGLVFEGLGQMGNAGAGMADVSFGLFRRICMGMIPGLVCITLSWLSRQALGYGDGALIAIGGISLGLPDCLQLLLTAFLAVGVFGIVLLVFLRKSRKYRIPFVPFLFLGAALTAFC